MSAGKSASPSRDPTAPCDCTRWRRGGGLFSLFAVCDSWLRGSSFLKVMIVGFGELIWLVFAVDGRGKSL